jgi:hypothetical protein
MGLFALECLIMANIYLGGRRSLMEVCRIECRMNVGELPHYGLRRSLKCMILVTLGARAGLRLLW